MFAASAQREERSGEGDIAKLERLRSLQAEMGESIVQRNAHCASRSQCAENTTKGTRQFDGDEEEIARLQSILQARDVQLQVLMRMLSEADASLLSSKQQIALLESRLSIALGSSGCNILPK